MTKVLTTVLIAAAALASTAAMAGGENAALESRAKLNALWGKTTAVEAPTSGQVSTSRAGEVDTFRALDPRRDRFSGTGWEGNWGAGRKFPPAGR